MSDQPRADIGPAGVTFFEDGGTVFYKNVLDARSAVGPREATQADVDRFPAEFEASGLTLPKAQVGEKAEATDANRESERLKREAAERQAAADRAQAADKARQAKLDVENAEKAQAAAADATKKAAEEKAAADKANADAAKKAGK
jgi:colicin import membrane protein